MMGNVTSTLLMRMIDGVSAPAAKARGALNAVNTSASRLAAQSGRRGAIAFLTGLVPGRARRGWARCPEGHETSSP